MVVREPRARGALEQEVLAALSVADGPLTPGDVREQIGGDIAYTTVMTTLTRLHAKKVLDREPAGRAYAYSIVGRAQDAQKMMTAHRMHKLLDTQPDRAGVLARFVSHLDSKEEKLLSELLDRSADKPPKPSRRRRGVSE